MEKPHINRSERFKQALESHDDADMPEILGNLGLSERELVGKKILDIGSGGGEFVRWANAHGAEAIAIDRRLDDKIRRRMEFAETPFVMGTAFLLPFPDDTFDYVVSHAAMPNITVEKSSSKKRPEIIGAETESRLQAVREALRVVKKNGEVRLAPVAGVLPGAKSTHQTESLEELMCMLSNDDSLEVKITLLPKDEGVDDDPHRVWYRLSIKHQDVLP